MLKPEEIHGLALLEVLTAYENKGAQAELLAKYFCLVENSFDYFLECLVISRNLQRQEKEIFPDETIVLEHVLKGFVDRKLQSDCFAYRHTHETYRHLISNIWQTLYKERQLFVASIILAYLNNEPEDKIMYIFDALENYDEQEEITMTEDPFYLKGVLFVKKLNENPNGPDNIWYGLVRREFHVMGSTICRTIPLGKNSLSFRTDLTNDLRRFYFWLWDSQKKIEGGLQFYFGPSDKFSVAFSGEFSQTVKGVTATDKKIEHPNWEATFYGGIENSRERFLVAPNYF